MSARADCTPSGQFAPSVIAEYHAERESQGCFAPPTAALPLTFSFCVVRNQHRRAICSRGFELPPAGAAAKARGGEGAQGGVTTTPPLVFIVPTPIFRGFAPAPCKGKFPFRRNGITCSTKLFCDKEALKNRANRGRNKIFWFCSDPCPPEA